MKKRFARYLILGFLITSVSNFSFASKELSEAEMLYCSNQSSICGTAPKDFTALLDFVREMTNSIKTMGTEGAYLGKYVNPNWFAGPVFTPPKTSILGRVARNIEQKIKFGLATTAIFSSPVNVAGLKDMLGGVILLAKNEVFLRDNKLVAKAESHLNDKNYELGLGGGWYVQVNKENRAIMQSIIKKYIDAGVLVSSSEIHAGVSYNNITSLLNQTLSAAKSFLYFGSLDQFHAMRRGSTDQGIFIGFTDTALQNIQREYDCARGPNYICSAQHKTLKKVLSTTWSSFSSGAALSKQTFTDAIDRLGQIFSPSQQDDKFKAREADLLRSMYGTQKMSKGTLADSLKKSWSTIKKSGAEVGQQFSDLGTDITSFRTFPKDLKGTFTGLPSSSPVITGDSTYLDITTVSLLLDTYLHDVFISQKTVLDLVSMAEVHPITPAFTVLGQQVSAIKNDILGGKDKNNSLIQSLGVACELQCGRGGLCW